MSNDTKVTMKENLSTLAVVTVSFECLIVLVSIVLFDNLAFGINNIFVFVSSSIFTFYRIRNTT